MRTGERVLWVGRPDPAVHFAPVDAFLIPFSIMWCGGVIFWEAGVNAANAPAFFRLWGIPFVVVGLYFVFGRFIFKARRKRRQVYALTDQRAIVVDGPSVADSPILNQPVTVRRSRSGNHASVTIGNAGDWFRSAAFYANTGMDFFRRGPVQIAFYDVAQPGAMLSALDHARQLPRS